MRKGFTLTEMLATLIIISLVFGFVAMNVMRSLDGATDEEYKFLSSIVESAAKVYVGKHSPNELEAVGGEYCVTLSQLDAEGLVELPINNPYEDTDYPSDTCIYVMNLSDDQLYYEFDAIEPHYHLELNDGCEATVSCSHEGFYNDCGASVVTPAGNVKATVYADPQTLATGGTKELVYSLYDGVDLIDSVTRNVEIVNNNTPEIIIGNNITSMDVDSGTVFTAPFALGYDDCEINLPITTSGTVDTSTIGTYTITYSTTNGSGITATKDLTVNVVQGPPAVGNWLYRKQLTIDSSKFDGSDPSHPIAVILDNTNFDFSKAKSDGSDIYFKAADGTTALDFEREMHDSTSEKAVYHVRVLDITDTADTTFYMYFGDASFPDSSNPAAVWDASYIYVDHMADSLGDSSSFGSEVTNYGTTVVDGMVGKARSFDGVDDYIDLIDSNFGLIGGKQASIIYLLARVDSITEPSEYLMSYGIPGSDRSYEIKLNSSNTIQTFCSPTATRVVYDNNDGLNLINKKIVGLDPPPIEPPWPSPINLGTYYLFLFTIDEYGSLDLFMKDLVLAAPSSAIDDDKMYSGGVATTRYLGKSASGGAHFHGLIDEIRIVSGSTYPENLTILYYSLTNQLLTYGVDENL